ncbi:MAG: biotin/lipoyl-binding protein, partial [Henriciella sp.]|nr:biotin/lipoyl-binding protein [Henriciella sp.]
MSGPEQEHAAKTSSGWVIGLIQLVFVIGVIGIAIGLTQVLKGQVNDRAPQIADLRGASEITVRVAETETLRFTPTIRVNGTVQAAAEVSVSPQVSGEIKFVSPAFRAGADVQKGDLLFEIDRADYVLAVQRAESEIAAASSDLQQLEAEAAIAVQEWK